MKTINLVKNKYRNLIGGVQNNVIEHLMQILIDYDQEVIADALFDSNIWIWTSSRNNIVRFDAKQLSRVCEIIRTYQIKENETKKI